MRSSLSELLESGRILLADGATGTNYFQAGLTSGEPPEFWNFDWPDRVSSLHDSFVEAGADIILTNTFGCNRHRLALHNAQERVHEIAAQAAKLARAVADNVDRPVIVAGSVGPTGSLFEPLGTLTEAEAIEVFAEQIEGLKAGGADVAWIETMSAVEEMQAAAKAAIRVGMPYVCTASFDTAGRTMMGLLPSKLVDVFDGLDVQPLAIGGNCGVGASDLLASLLAMTERPDAAERHIAHVVKGNCGIPQFRGTEIHYSGTPELMGKYATLAAHSGARIIGGCCGTSPEHLASMRAAIDTFMNDGVVASRPTLESVVEATGAFFNPVPGAGAPEAGGDRVRRRSRS